MTAPFVLKLGVHDAIIEGILDHLISGKGLSLSSAVAATCFQPVWNAAKNAKLMLRLLVIVDRNAAAIASIECLRRVLHLIDGGDRGLRVTAEMVMDFGRRGLSNVSSSETQNALGKAQSHSDRRINAAHPINLAAIVECAAYACDRAVSRPICNLSEDTSGSYTVSYIVDCTASVMIRDIDVLNRVDEFNDALVLNLAKLADTIRRVVPTAPDLASYVSKRNQHDVCD